MADDEARTLADVKAEADERDRDGLLPPPGTPGDPGLQILNTTGEGALMRDPQRDPLLSGLLADEGTFEAVPDLTEEQILSVVTNAIGFEMFRHDGREVKQVEGVEGVDLTPEETDLAVAAAHRVLLDLSVARHPFDDLRRLQNEQAAWSARNFEPLDPPGHVAAMGMGEEVGELAEAMVQQAAALALIAKVGKVLHFQLKGEQSIRYTPAEIKAKKADAAADTLIYLVDFCTRNGIDLADVVRDTWAEVSARDWAANPIDAAEIAKAGMPAPKLGDDVADLQPGMRVRCTHDTLYKEGGDPTTVHTIVVEEGDRGTIDSIDADGTILVVWDSLVGPREVLYADIEPTEHSVEPERPAVIHYASDRTYRADQASDVGVALDDALAQGGTFDHLEG